MNAALAAAPAATDAITLPLVLTVACATVALVAIAVFVRRSRLAGRLTGVTAAASGVSAAGILASALLVSVALGGSTVASADTVSGTGIPQPGFTDSSVTVVSPTVGPPTSDDLSGPQLPTE
ncbi:hypothetical protein F1C58_09330 [Glaciihabitans sp. INWT7]|uniref:hypothetical protein n=1 Tax=Glaciihabitans sp. INWT7 TaxID=2596912 RepID=UPI001627CDAD|nr:hypothetical protein [Glaciihabitans sp. INWT7]QNE47079.1 hypothetical protein F1C58_09330 [Glaciihabitans sp. INWT7]